MDTVGHRLVVALASRLFHIFDVRKMDTPEQTRESSLKFLTRALACMSDGQGRSLCVSSLLSWQTVALPGYATASVEGRIAVEYFDPSPAIQEKKYAFKCHRQTIDDVDHVWPVNALAFHPTYNTFASGGSDATVSIWDHKVKKRLRQYTRYNAPVAALAFSADGARLAVGASYTWDAGEEGARTAERPSLFVRELGEEVKVRLNLNICPSASCAGSDMKFFLVAKGMGHQLSTTPDTLLAMAGSWIRFVGILIFTCFTGVQFSGRLSYAANTINCLARRSGLSGSIALARCLWSEYRHRSAGLFSP
jgi:WD domain, G-beta repeat